MIQKLIEKVLVGDGDEALKEYPLHIRRAFVWVGVYDDPYGYEETLEKATENQKKDPWERALLNLGGCPALRARTLYTLISMNTMKWLENYERK